MRHVLVLTALLVLLGTTLMAAGCHASGDVDTNSATQVGVAR